MPEVPLVPEVPEVPLVPDSGHYCLDFWDLTSMHKKTPDISAEGALFTIYLYMRPNILAAYFQYFATFGALSL